MGRRWILARPRGGLNDTLCQIEKCWRFAEKTGRELVIDTKDSGLLLDFHQVFEVKPEGSNVIPHKFSEELVDQLNKLSAFPADVERNVTTYDKFKDEHDEFYTLPSRQTLKFSLKKDFPEDLVVYEGMGGGVDSFCVLRRLVLQQGVRTRVIETLKVLPEKYVGVHVRHTDMTTDYESFFDIVRGKNRQKNPVLVASDNDEVLLEANRIFGAQNIFTLSGTLSRDGTPLHAPNPSHSLTERFERTSATLAELFALAHSSSFFFTEVTNRRGVSGFSRLTAYLVGQPTLRSSLLNLQETESGDWHQKSIHIAPISRRILEKIRWSGSNCMFFNRSAKRFLI